MVTGRRRLEVRRHGPRQNLPLDLYAGLYPRNSINHLPGAVPLRYHETDRYKVQQNRKKEDDVDEHGSRGGLVYNFPWLTLRSRSEVSALPNSRCFLAHTLEGGIFFKFLLNSGDNDEELFPLGSLENASTNETRT